MAKFWEHFRHGEFRRYYARPFSAAASFVTVSWFITIIVPWLIAYSCHQFWIKTMWYSEQPKATFQNQLLVLLETQTPGQVITWSTATNYNLMVGNSYIVRPPILTSYEVDVNMDGLTDFLNFTMEMPLFANEQIFGVQLLLVFKHITYKNFYSVASTVAYIHYDAFRPGASLSTVGEMVLRQRDALPYFGSDLSMQSDFLNSTSPFIADFDIPTLMQNYVNRNVSFMYEYISSWKSGRSPDRPFMINAIVNYPTTVTYLYRPGFWFNVKWAWMAYVPVLLVFLVVMEKIRQFVLNNQLLNCVIVRPWETQPQL